MARDVDSKDLEKVSGGALRSTPKSLDSPSDFDRRERREPPPGANPTEGIDSDADSGDTADLDQS